MSRHPQRGDLILDPEQAADLLAATHVPAVVPSRFATPLRLFARSSLTLRQESMVRGWDEWVDLAKRLRLRVWVRDAELPDGPHRFAGTKWRDKFAWLAYRDAVRQLNEREQDGGCW
jgi:hypothetical protein